MRRRPERKLRLGKDMALESRDLCGALLAAHPLQALVAESSAPLESEPFAIDYASPARPALAASEGQPAGPSQLSFDRRGEREAGRVAEAVTPAGREDVRPSDPREELGNTLLVSILNSFEAAPAAARTPNAQPDLAPVTGPRGDGGAAAPSTPVSPQVGGAAEAPAPVSPAQPESQVPPQSALAVGGLGRSAPLAGDGAASSDDGGVQPMSGGPDPGPGTDPPGGSMLLLNEVKVNAPGSDAPYEYIEIKAPATAPLGYCYAVVVRGDGGTAAGTATFVANLDTYSVGENGLLLLRGSGGHAAMESLTTVVVDSRLDSGNRLHDGAASVLLIQSQTAVSEGTDYDLDDNGTLEALPTGALILDAVGWRTWEFGEQVYGGVELAGGSWTPGAATRFRADDRALWAEAWYYGALSGTASTVQYDGAQVSANFPTGGMLTPGGANAPEPVLPVITIGATDPSGAELFADPGLFTITRTGPTDETLHVYYTVGGGATNGLDYQELAGFVEIPEGEASVSIALVPIDDALQEGAETVVLTLDAVPGYEVGTASSATVTIADDATDTGPQVSIVATDASASEVGGDGALFTLTRTGSVSAGLTVSYDIGGTAENGVDYTSLTGSVTFGVGASTATVAVSPIDDDRSEEDETINLTLRPQAAYQVSATAAFASATLTSNAADDKVEIKFLDSSKANTLTKLRVAKWNGAYNAAGDALRDTTTADIFDKDGDRFHIQVKDPDKAGQANITVQVSTDSPQLDYDDNATNLVLARKAGTTDVFETAANRAHVLVSNAADNRLAVDGVANNAQNDRTHIVALDGSVKVEYGTNNKTATVPIEKRVTLSVTILTDTNNVPLIAEPYVDSNNNEVWDAREAYRDVDSSGDYTLRLSIANSRRRAEQDVVVVNESYAQVGMFFTANIGFATAPAVMSDGKVTLSPNSPNGDANLSDHEKALLRDAGYNSAARDDVEVYYAVSTYSAPDYFRGWSFIERYYRNMMTTDLYDSLMLPNCATYYTLAHELWHVFTNVSRHGDKPNLSADTPNVVFSSAAQAKDNKRLTAAQQTTFHKTEYAKAP